MLALPPAFRLEREEGEVGGVGRLRKLLTPEARSRMPERNTEFRLVASLEIGDVLWPQTLRKVKIGSEFDDEDDVMLGAKAIVTSIDVDSPWGIGVDLMPVDWQHEDNGIGYFFPRDAVVEVFRPD
jgi:hypothetical protein